jgi:hypothetical protein
MQERTEFVSRETAKTLIHDRAIEMALNNVGFKADASDILEHISKRSMDWIDSIPPADVRPVVRGRWIWDENGMDWGLGAWICSQCRHRPETTWQTMSDIIPLRWSGSHFCPNCGAEMSDSQTLEDAAQDADAGAMAPVT